MDRSIVIDVDVDHRSNTSFYKQNHLKLIVSFSVLCFVSIILLLISNGMNNSNEVLFHIAQISSIMTIMFFVYMCIYVMIMHKNSSNNKK